jgi:protein SCO1/2
MAFSSKNMMRSRRGTTVLMLAAGALLVAGAVFGVVQTLQPRAPKAPGFTLRSASGTPFDLGAERGQTVALFFGYTHCPDVCPTTLAALARARASLPADRRAHVQVVFVTVDPVRDTPAVTARYARMFDPSFIGLSGSQAKLARVWSAYHVYHQKLPGTAAGGYLMAHSSTIFFIGPDGRMRAIGDWSDTVHQLASEIERAQS